MAITARGTGTSSDTTQCTLVKPSGTVSGDVGYAFVYSDGTAAASLAGWVALKDLALAGPSFFHLTVLRRVMDGSEGASFAFNTSSSTSAEGHLIVLTGVDNTTPEDATTPNGSENTIATATYPSITTITDNAWHLAFVCQDTTSNSVTLPTSYTQQTTFDGARLSTRAITPAGSVSGVTSTTSPTPFHWATMSVAVRPAPMVAATTGPSGVHPGRGPVLRMARFFKTLRDTIYQGPATIVRQEIAYRAGQTAAAAGTSLVLNVPAGVVNGDVMVAFVTGFNLAPVLPAGWTLIQRGSDGAGDQVALAYRVAYNEPASYTWTLGSAGGSALCDAFFNVDQTYPLDVVPPAANSGTSATPVTWPSLTTITDGAWSLAYYEDAGNHELTVGPAGFTKRSDQGGVENLWTKPIGIGGTVSAPTATGAGLSSWLTAQIALRAAPAGSSASVQGTVPIVMHPGRGPVRIARFFETARDTTTAVSGAIAAVKDVALRFSLAARAFKDAGLRFGLAVRSYKDVGLRFSLFVQAFKDVGLRFSMVSRAWKDVGLRFFLNVRAYKDAALRFSLTARSWQDIAIRFRLSANAFKDAGLRFFLGIRGFQDVGMRFRLTAIAQQGTVSRGFHPGAGTTVARFYQTARDRTVQAAAVFIDIGLRFRLTAVAYKDAALRFGLAIRAYKDVGLRASLSARAFKDIALRFSLAARTFKDAALRFGLAVRAYKDAALRFSLAARTYKDVALRFSLSARTFKDIALRFGLAIRAYKDAALRFSLAARTFKDVGLRFNLASLATYKDIALRFRLSARTVADTALRFGLGVRAFKDITLRMRLSARSFKDIGLRASISVRAFQDAAVRFRLGVRGFKDAALRFRLVPILWRDVGLRFALVSGLGGLNDGSDPDTIRRYMRERRRRIRMSRELGVGVEVWTPSP